ncbi:MAG: glycosyltransferase family 4 protein [Chitinophagaceae bacterium]|nr:glycosyltransferase family 4 protein [Chitinophagaceae bacterium]
MRIGFDAKRAYHNNTGLGNYSRSLIMALSAHYPNHEYHLFNPKKNVRDDLQAPNIYQVNPESFSSRLLPSIWRSKWMIQDIEQRTDLYHGLSHELPYGIHLSNIKTLVTMHDLIFEHYPDHYNLSDRMVYRNKFRYAARTAHRVIAISEATRKDLIKYYDIPSDKIHIVPPSIDDRFYQEQGLAPAILQKRYGITKPYFISVGSIIERKNLLRVVEAFHSLLQQFECQLVIIGKGGNAYADQVNAYIKSNHLEPFIIFPEQQQNREEVSRDLPALYQSSLALVYPSVMEGFGLPVVEAMASGTVAITSNGSSLLEAGGEAALLVDPLQTASIYSAMESLVDNPFLREQRILLGHQQASKFTQIKMADAMMKHYQDLYP